MKKRLFIILFTCIVLDWYIKNNIVPKNDKPETKPSLQRILVKKS